MVVLDSVAIALGVAAITLALAVDHSTRHGSNAPVNGLDRTTVVVEGTPSSSSGIQAGLVSSTTLTSGDLSALGNPGYVPDASVVAPVTGIRTQVATTTSSATSEVIGSTDTFPTALGYGIASGRLLTPADVVNSAPVVVLGSTVVNALFPNTTPLGQSVTINGQAMQVVGTFQHRGFSGTLDQDNLVVAPITAVWKYVTPLQNQVDQVVIRASNPGAAARAAHEATTVLLERHGIADPALADFTVLRHSQLVAGQTGAGTAVRRLLELGAALFLLVGMLHGVQRTILRRRPMTLAMSLSVGLVAVAAGIILAVLVAPALHHLFSLVPVTHLTLYGVVVGAVLGLIAATIQAAPLPAPGGGADGDISDATDSAAPPLAGTVSDRQP
jgi:putative ABC transport system permease protein